MAWIGIVGMGYQRQTVKKKKKKGIKICTSLWLSVKKDWKSESPHNDPVQRTEAEL